MTVATMPLPRSCWLSAQLSAMTAISWSPSTIVPFSSTMMHPVRIAIERDADIGAHLVDLLLQRDRAGGAAIEIDVGAVRLVADRDDLGAELPEHGRRHLIGSAIGAIDGDPQALQRHVARQRALGMFDIAVDARRRRAWRGRYRRIWQAAPFRSFSSRSSISASMSSDSL